MLLAVNDKFTSYKDFREAFFTVEGSGVPAEVLKKCGSRFQILSAENKSKYHAAAVFASNFVVALAELSCELLEECGFSYDDAFAAIRPLLKNNMNNILKNGPKNALTGPIERGDFETVKRHIECFKNSEPDITAKKVYAAVSEALIRQTGRQPDSETARNAEK